MNGLDLIPKNLPQFLEQRVHLRRHGSPVTLLAAWRISPYTGPGNQNPITTTRDANTMTGYFFHGSGAAGGNPGSGPNTSLAICARNPAKITASKPTKMIAGPY